MLTFIFSSATRNSILSKPLKFPTPENLISHFHSISRISNPAIQFILEEAEEDFPSSREPIQSPSFGNGEIPRSRDSGSGVQISHPWTEWIDLMKKLLKNGYFSGDGNPFPRNNESGIKDSNQIRTACLNFARDQFDLVRHMSRKNIQVISEAGCPSIDRKVVNSGKRLRAYLGIDEGNVCSSCILRGNCERAYIKLREDEGIGRTVDVMRFLLTYGLDPTCGSVETKSHMNKRLEESVRKLLKEMVELSINEGDGYESQDASSVVRSSTQGIAENHKDSTVKAPMKPGDWLCTNCNFLNFARNIKCLRCNGLSQERLHNLRSEQDNLPLKKGDWICDKCNFLNFAKNTRCLQCKENPPKRTLHPGEWECESWHSSWRSAQTHRRADPCGRMTAAYSQRGSGGDGDGRLDGGWQKAPLVLASTLGRGGYDLRFAVVESKVMAPEAAWVAPNEVTVSQDPAVVEALAAKLFDGTNTAQGWWRPDKVATMFGGTGTAATRSEKLTENSQQEQAKLGGAITSISRETWSA